MENQHRKIVGYRELSQLEVDLMNEIKALGNQMSLLLATVDAHLLEQADASDETGNARMIGTTPRRWVSIARIDFQTGLMALTRAVAQPTSF